ncbi:DNA-binding GntR family transcriptional regulator [Caldalkalibacillus uzonensis]|uniref:DNA-binding GntR family transcriptional regulator n=1 Tax=Caldalkalibacillus uzonensis TaxID=353224 RepID=A0ABU0CWI1_9BACI|nr:GntR family transcriptional regulator [Caldalkalibacillus uzonensis]MDQ0340778.1 DNA-binding GntR family transcriptional regulator [Caldalkalibacillus uzonensis]
MEQKRGLQLEDRSTLQKRVCNILREAILKGDFQPGERLVQDELAQELGVSRMPVREALRQLESEGLVVLEPHKGAIVKMLSLHEVEEIYTLRAMLESLALEKSIPLLTTEDIAELEHLLHKMEGGKDNAHQFIEANMQFHRLLFKGCSWQRLKGLIRSLSHGVPNYTPFLLEGQIHLSNQEHRAIVEAIKVQDIGRATRLMAKHIHRTGEDLKAFMLKNNGRSS